MSHRGGAVFNPPHFRKNRKIKISLKEKKKKAAEVDPVLSAIILGAFALAPLLFKKSYTRYHNPFADQTLKYQLAIGDGTTEIKIQDKDGKIIKQFKVEENGDLSDPDK